MSSEADFGISGWVFQANGAQVDWSLAWSQITEDRYVGVSFQSDFTSAELQRVSEWFCADRNENPFIRERIRATMPFGDGVAFQFSVIVIPSH